MYQLTVETLFIEAAALVVCGFLVGLVYDGWIAVVAPGLLMVCEDDGDQVAESGRTAAVNTTVRANHSEKEASHPGCTHL